MDNSVETRPSCLWITVDNLWKLVDNFLYSSLFIRPVPVDKQKWKTLNLNLRVVDNRTQKL